MHEEHLNCANPGSAGEVCPFLALCWIWAAAALCTHRLDAAAGASGCRDALTAGVSRSFSPCCPQERVGTGSGKASEF